MTPGETSPDEPLPIRPKKKLPITTFLIASTLLVMVFICGGGFLYMDYHSGSLSSTSLPNPNGGQRMNVTAHSRGFSGGGTGIRASAVASEAHVAVGKEEFTVTRDAVKFRGKILVELPAETNSVEIEGYRGRYRVIADGELVGSMDGLSE